mmetsp:Transcript_93708/g.236111  ORF Transcript_93708/g.236111 Transcript_93708/m.236111 type:complete len:206 (-) Transcript_93708:98-715(-)
MQPGGGSTSGGPSRATRRGDHSSGTAARPPSASGGCMGYWQGLNALVVVRGRAAVLPVIQQDHIRHELPHGPGLAAVPQADHCPVGPALFHLAPHPGPHSESKAVVAAMAAGTAGTSVVMPVEPARPPLDTAAPAGGRRCRSQGWPPRREAIGRQAARDERHMLVRLQVSAKSRLLQHFESHLFPAEEATGAQKTAHDHAKRQQP